MSRRNHKAVCVKSVSICICLCIFGLYGAIQMLLLLLLLLLLSDWASKLQ